MIYKRISQKNQVVKKFDLLMSLAILLRRSRPKGAIALKFTR
ncbi:MULTISPECIES: hypothetical protein [Brasilonema]|nr:MULTISPECIES: hypothetical protein [Brasilonema]